MLAVLTAVNPAVLGWRRRILPRSPGSQDLPDSWLHQASVPTCSTACSRSQTYFESHRHHTHADVRRRVFQFPCLSNMPTVGIPPIAPSPCTLDELADFVDRADRVLQRCSRDPVARLFSSNFDLSAARTLHSQVLHTLPAFTRIGEHDENQLPSQQCRS